MALTNDAGLLDLPMVYQMLRSCISIAFSPAGELIWGTRVADHWIEGGEEVPARDAFDARDVILHYRDVRV